MFVITRTRRAALLMALTSSLLAACGGGSDDGSASLRMINATADVDALDLTIDNDDIDETRQIAGVARDGQSEYSEIADKNFTLRVKRAGASSTLAITSGKFDKGKRHQLIAFGREGDYRVLTAVDDEDEPSAGKAKLRVLNAAADAGALDVYLTETEGALADTLPTISSVGGGQLSSYNTLDRRSYRLRITAAGDKDDLRLDLPAIELGDKARLTLIVQPGAGGVLVHTLVSQYQGAITALKNASVRVRLVAGAAGNAAVTARLAGRSLNVNLRSPSVGSYTLLPAGNAAAAITVNADIALGGDVQLVAGSDYTLAVFGSASAPGWRLISDDNRLPSSSSDRTKMRLLHFAHGTDANLTLVKDYVAVANDVAYGTASPYSLVASSSKARVEVTSPLTVTPLFLEDEAVLPTRGVFTIFMIGGGSAAPTGILRRER